MTIEKLLRRLLLIIILILIALFTVIKIQLTIVFIIYFILLAIVLYFFWPITKRRTAKKIICGRNISSRKYVWLSRYKLIKIKKKNKKLKLQNSLYRWYITDSWKKNIKNNFEDIGNDLILILKEKTKRLK